MKGIERKGKGKGKKGKGKEEERKEKKQRREKRKEEERKRKRRGKGKERKEREKKTINCSNIKGLTQSYCTVSNLLYPDWGGSKRKMDIYSIAVSGVLFKR